MAFLLYDRWPTKKIGHAYPMTQNLPSCPEIPGGVPVLFCKLLRATWVNVQNNLRCHLVTWREKKKQTTENTACETHRSLASTERPWSRMGTTVWSRYARVGRVCSVWRSTFCLGTLSGLAFSLSTILCTHTHTHTRHAIMRSKLYTVGITHTTSLSSSQRNYKQIKTTACQIAVV